MITKYNSKPSKMSKSTKAVVAATVLGCAFALPSAASAMEDYYQMDMTPLSSIEASAPAKASVVEAPVEMVVRYKVHRSPVREDNLGLHVVTLDTKDELRIVLPGIEGVSFNAVCRTSSGARLACGSRARAQFVNLVALREISCRVAIAPQSGAEVQACSVEGVDIAEWLIRNGIGRPTAQGLHLAALREARAGERGMWADAEIRNGFVVASN